MSCFLQDEGNCIEKYGKRADASPDRQCDLLLVAVSAILMLSGRENYARQMQQMEAYIQGLSGRTAQHASDVFCG